MNCIKCPVTEECRITNMIETQTEYVLGRSILIKMEPYNKEDCPLIKLLRKLKISDST